jgi:hypothetical protein
MKDMEMRFAVSKIAFPPRLALFAGCAVAGFALQVLDPGGLGLLLGLAVMIPGVLFMWAKGYNNKPMDIGQENWQPASVREFDRIKSNLQLTRRKKFSVIYRNGFGWFIAIVLLVMAFFFSAGESRLGTLACADALALLLPFLLSGNVSLWTPQELASRMRVFEPILASQQSEGGPIIITPYLRLDKDKEGHQIPEDIRLMVEPRRKPADFLGVQLQVAVNKGPNGEVPYMYSVFLCKGKGETYGRLSNGGRPTAGSAMSASGTTSRSRAGTRNTGTSWSGRRPPAPATTRRTRMCVSSMTW